MGKVSEMTSTTVTSRHLPTAAWVFECHDLHLIQKVLTLLQFQPIHKTALIGLAFEIPGFLQGTIEVGSAADILAVRHAAETVLLI